MNTRQETDGQPTIPPASIILRRGTAPPIGPFGSLIAADVWYRQHKDRTGEGICVELVDPSEFEGEQ